MAIAHANTVLDWQEHLPEDEMPPAWMWPLDHELEPWFAEVHRKREERYGVGSDDRESVPMMSNELTKGRR